MSDQIADIIRICLGDAALLDDVNFIRERVPDGLSEDALIEHLAKAIVARRKGATQ